MSNQTDPEVWRVVPGVSGYLASSHGRIMKTPYLSSVPGGGFRNYGGEPWSGCWDGSRYIAHIKGAGTFKVARMVCEAFHGTSPSHLTVCMHLDENSRNNRPENLRWGTQKENLNAPGYRQKMKARTKADLVKTTRQQRAEIIKRHKAGEPQSKLAKSYGLSPCRVSSICKTAST